MQENSYFSYGLDAERAYLVVYPLDSLSMLNMFSPKTSLRILNLYIEEGEMLIGNPCPVYTEKDFQTVVTINEMLVFLSSKNNLFVMQFEFELINEKIKIKVDDDARIRFELLDITNNQIKEFLGNTIKAVGYFNSSQLIENLLQNTGKYICVNEKGEVWKIVDTYNELLEDQDVLVMY